MRQFPILSACLCLLPALSAAALGQSRTYEMTDQGWAAAKTPEPGTPGAVIAQARTLLADGKPEEAIAVLNPWIAANETTRSEFLPEAYLLRGDCKVADSDEYEALRDYEAVVKDYSGSEFFVRALEREFDVAKLYLGGLNKKTWIFRIDSGIPTAEEIILRINERLPGSRLAETAMLALADYYYKARDLRMAAESYDVFLKLFPRSEHRQKAMQRRVYANVAQFKGPDYDASGLIEARFQIERFQAEFPAQADPAGMGDALVARLNESAGEQKLNTANWYMTRGDPVSARLTLQRLVRTFPGTGAAEKAVEMLNKNGWPLETARTPRVNPPAPAKDTGKDNPAPGGDKPVPPANPGANPAAKAPTPGAGAATSAAPGTAPPQESPR